MRVYAGIPWKAWLVYSIGVAALAACSESPESSRGQPEILDPDLTIELIASEPELVTPIGLATDETDHLYVLESHTHTPPRDYPGPAYDRIKKGLDEDGDGIPESWITFADSIQAGMNLAFGPDQTLYLVEKNRVRAYRDRDGDGRSDTSRVLLRMVDPAYVYDHAGLLGVTVSPDGWVYVSRGNTGGQGWTLLGTDGSKLHGYGDGGNIVRCRPDGSDLQAVATGFWNPFDLKFTLEGRLMAIDNDPDSRGPNRLLDIVPGGDYGYQSLYGGSGIHPFLAWNGERPGTLPYAAALGEAPSGMIDAGHTAFPARYEGNILATIWEENTLVRIPLRRHQSSVRGEAQVILRGDSLFHPVALAANSRGELYLTDWVVRQYPNHGRGGLWRIRARKPLPGRRPSAAGSKQLEARWTGRFTSRAGILEGLRSGDPFLATAARRALLADAGPDEILALTGQAENELRLQALLAARQDGVVLPAGRLRQLLRDSVSAVRRVALVHVAREGRIELLPDVENMLYEGMVGPDLFETFLATVRHLQPEFIEGLAAEAETKSAKLRRQLPPGYLVKILLDENLDPAIRALALPFSDQPGAELPALLEMLPDAQPALQEALLHTLRALPDEEVAKSLRDLALDERVSAPLRTLAVLGMSAQPKPYCQELAGLLQTNDPGLRRTVVRHLCRCADDPAVAERLEQDLRTHPASLEIWRLCNGKPEKAQQAVDEQAWAARLDGKGDPDRGQYVFQLAVAQCQTCHQVGHWGGAFGPALTHVGSSKSREQLITAILDPSQEISPEWQGWYVTDRTGRTHFGRQIDVGFDDAELMLPSGAFVRYDQPRDYGMADHSLMPEGLEKGLTVAEFNDLIAYLESLK